eukprot:TRINITY_DN2904_c0_g1_i1.p1 TRINITY_DN2904_c0_g1~~TRINITY_DN2904_c0_g1_i1.p1  ORF type:complete len:339 (+),score=94.22 TRINITY_DN2904_c0_g1_i1:52-1068(+)
MLLRLCRVSLPKGVRGAFSASRAESPAKPQTVEKPRNFQRKRHAQGPRHTEAQMSAWLLQCSQEHLTPASAPPQQEPEPEPEPQPVVQYNSLMRELAPVRRATPQSALASGVLVDDGDDDLRDAFAAAAGPAPATQRPVLPEHLGQLCDAAGSPGPEQVLTDVRAAGLQVDDAGFAVVWLRAAAVLRKWGERQRQSVRGPRGMRAVADVTRSAQQHGASWQTATRMRMAVAAACRLPTIVDEQLRMLLRTDDAAADISAAEAKAAVTLLLDSELPDSAAWLVQKMDSTGRRPSPDLMATLQQKLLEQRGVGAAVRYARQTSHISQAPRLSRARPRVVC